jgi:hypothetical protein
MRTPVIVILIAFALPLSADDKGADQKKVQSIASLIKLLDAEHYNNGDLNHLTG